MTLLRFVHISSAIFWVGTTLFMLFFVEPMVRSLGPDGSKFTRRLIGGTRFSLVMALSGWITVLAGLLLYGPVTGWTAEVIFRLRLPLTLGAIAGLAAGFSGSFIQGRASGRLLALGKEIAPQGGPSAQAQAAEMGRLQARLRLGSRGRAADGAGGYRHDLVRKSALNRIQSIFPRTKVTFDRMIIEF